MPMYTYGLDTTHFVEIPDPATPGQTIRPPAGLRLTVQDAFTLLTPTTLTDTAGTPITDVLTDDYGYVSFRASSPTIRVSADVGVTWHRLIGAEAIDDAIAGVVEDGSVTAAKLAATSPAADEFLAFSGTELEWRPAPAGTGGGSSNASDLTSGTLGIERLPAGSILAVRRVSGAWPARPTARADITCNWIGPDPSPPIVTSGTGGMRSDIDIRAIVVA
jgi:hypothetical protein